MQKYKQKIKFFVVWQRKTVRLSGKCLFLQCLNLMERFAYSGRKLVPISKPGSEILLHSFVGGPGLARLRSINAALGVYQGIRSFEVKYRADKKPSFSRFGLNSPSCVLSAQCLGFNNRTIPHFVIPAQAGIHRVNTFRAKSIEALFKIHESIQINQGQTKSSNAAGPLPALWRHC